MLKWLTQKEFSDIFEKDYHSHKKDLIIAFQSESPNEKIENVLDITKAIYLDEDNGLGPRYHWFGQVENDLFQISGIEIENPYFDLFFREKDEEKEKYQWTFLEKLRELPLKIFQEPVWIRSDFISKRIDLSSFKKSVFYKNDYGIICPIYNAITADEAEELIIFLNSLNPIYPYWVGDSENANHNWVAIRQIKGEADKIIARYPSRCVTEMFALRKSSKDDAVYWVKNETTDEFHSLFVKGVKSKK